jgi:hypothetical protein
LYKNLNIISIIVFKVHVNDDKKKIYWKKRSKKGQHQGPRDRARELGRAEK